MTRLDIDIASLKLKRLGESERAGLWVTSLPWPRRRAAMLSLAGKPTYVSSLGQWPSEPNNTPRRLLLAGDGGDGGDGAPETIGLQQHVAAVHAPPAVAMECFERSKDRLLVWERHLVRVSWGGKSIGLALGLRTKNEIHWWEACKVVTLRETNQGREVEMGGAIPLQLNGAQLTSQNRRHTDPFLHRHNWLNGHLYLRMHSNGVCEVFVHHINSKFYDDGLDLADAVPVIGIKTSEESDLAGVWDGSRSEFSIGAVAFDAREAARLRTPQQPGSMTHEDGFLVWQPYQGFEIYSGEGARQQVGDPFICHAEDHNIPRGAARTVRFSFSLSERSPRIARYLAPASWYGQCEEFGPMALTPAPGEFDSVLEENCVSIRRHIRVGGFEDGWLPMRLNDEANNSTTRADSSWKGDIPHSLLMASWRSGNECDYQNALRLAYHFTDIAVDHAMQAVRMQGYLPTAVAPTLGRVQGAVAAYFEVGDPYLLRTAKAVLETTFATHLNSWPRMAVGRDACFISGALLLYRYCGDDHYRQIAYEGALAVVATQKDDGSFGDQGGGAGIHGVGAYITKPWMGMLATSGLLDYLELFPDEKQFLDTVKKFADWLMNTRMEHKNGLGWTYQHDYAGTREYSDTELSQMFAPPTKMVWHQESLGRLLGFCALHFNDARYWNAYRQSRRLAPPQTSDYAVHAALSCLPWLNDRQQDLQKLETQKN